MTDRVTQEMLRAGWPYLTRKLVDDANEGELAGLYLAMLAKDERVQALVRALEAMVAGVTHAEKEELMAKSWMRNCTDDKLTNARTALAQFGGNHGG